MGLTRKGIAMLLVTCSVMGLVACGSKEAEETVTETPVENEAGTDEVSEGAAEMDASLADAESIKLGVAITQTGTQSSVGVESQRGLEIAVNEINAAGGVCGKQIETIIYDDQGTPEASLKAVTRLVEQDDVDVIFGPMSSNSMMAVGEYLNSSEMVTVGPAVGVAWLRQGWDYIFRSTSNSYIQTVQAVEILKSLDVKTLGIYNINEEYGNNSKIDMENLLEEQGLDIEVVVEEVYKDGDTDFTSQSVKIANANPDAVFMVVWANDAGSMLKQLRQAGYTGPVVGDNSFPGLPIREVAGDASDNVYCTAAYILPDTVEEIDNNPSFANPKMNQFLHTYYDTYGTLPTNDNCYRSYDAVYIIAEAIKNAGSLESSAIRDALAELHDFECLVGTMDYRGNDGEGIFQSKMYKLEGGKITEYIIE